MATKGVTLSKLSRELSRHLGDSFSFVQARAQALQTAGLIPSGKGGHNACNAATLEPQHALLVLLAVLDGKTGERAAKAAHVYSDLPLASANKTEMPEGGGQLYSPLNADSDLVADINSTSGTFLSFLRTSLVRAWRFRSPDIGVRAIGLGGGRGNPVAWAIVGPPPTDAGDLVPSATFYFAPEMNPGGQLPDDAPRCRRNTFHECPGEILARLADLFPDDAHKRHAADLWGERAARTDSHSIQQ